MTERKCLVAAVFFFGSFSNENVLARVKRLGKHNAQFNLIIWCYSLTFEGNHCQTAKTKATDWIWSWNAVDLVQYENKILIQIGWLNCSETLSQPKNDYRFRLSLVAASCRNDRFLLFLLGEHHQVRDRRLSDHFQWASLWVCVFEKRSPKSTEYELKCSIVHCSMFSHWMFCPHGLVSELNGIKCKKKTVICFSHACAYISNSLNYTCLLSAHFPYLCISHWRVEKNMISNIN